ncbi:MAG: polysaccharide deacetylase family protein [Nitrososphaeraceae archaeon]|nr:polysaccharide deacetylase family protein [Nitrososphaeraceae archaeon]
MKIIISIIGLLIASAILINGNLFFKSVSALILNDLISTENIYNDKDRLTLDSLFENNYGIYGAEKEKLAEKEEYRSNDTPDIQSLSDEDDYFLSNDNSDKEKGQLTNDDKIVILMFDRGYKSIFSMAKPIMDKYGFKASIFIACDYVNDGDGMDWDQVRELYQNGYDIQSHGLEHKRLTELKSSSEIDTVVSGGRDCLEEQGFSPTIFQAPYNKGGDDPKIIDAIGRNFDLAFTGHSELMFLNCDGWENFGYDKENYQGITDCRPYSYDGKPTPTNKYAMKEWSHDREHDRINDEIKEGPHGEEVSQALFDKFVQIVNQQSSFNNNGEINAIPIIGYHKISTDDSVSTSQELFEEEMAYLNENGFQVITLDDIGYDEANERFYIHNLNA